MYNFHQNSSVLSLHRKMENGRNMDEQFAIANVRIRLAKADSK